MKGANPAGAAPGASIVFAIPGDLSAPTGGYGYDRRILALLPREGVEVTHLRLPDGFPHPDAGALKESCRLLGATPPGSALLVDGLAFGVLDPDRIGALDRCVVALVHHPLGLEDGLSAPDAARLVAAERAALAAADGVVVTSNNTARLLAAEFGVAPERIAVATCGTDPAPRARPAGREPLRLLAVGSVVPRKGYDVLVDALTGLDAAPDWRLTVIGALDRASAHASALEGRIAEAGLAGRVRLAGAQPQSAVEAALGAADLFVMPSRFEGFGMALTEAVARGLPIVTTTGGALRETLPAGAGVAVPPGDAASLRAAIAAMLRDARARARASDAAWAAAQNLPRWEAAAATVARACRTALAARAARETDNGAPPP